MENKEKKEVSTTGHVWDDDLEEYNNPLPTWWLWTFYGTLVYAFVYWVLFPSWPVGGGYLTGVLQEEITVEGETRSHNWNTRVALIKDMEEARQDQAQWFDKIAAMPPEQIAKDPNLLSFAISAGKTSFGENCSACHRASGQGNPGVAPALVDDDWLIGGSMDKIQSIIEHGRKGYMPAFSVALKNEEIDALTHYVMSLSGGAHDPGRASAGKSLFNNAQVGCYACHGMDGKGRQDIGAPNLADAIWLWVGRDGGGKVRFDEVKGVIANGLQRGNMPAWKDRLAPEQIKVLTVYVHELGGGE